MSWKSHVASRYKFPEVGWSNHAVYATALYHGPFTLNTEKAAEKGLVCELFLIVIDWVGKCTILSRVGQSRIFADSLAWPALFELDGTFIATTLSLLEGKTRLACATLLIAGVTVGQEIVADFATVYTRGVTYTGLAVGTAWSSHEHE